MTHLPLVKKIAATKKYDHIYGHGKSKEIELTYKTAIKHGAKE